MTADVFMVDPFESGTVDGGDTQNLANRELSNASSP